MCALISNSIEIRPAVSEIKNKKQVSQHLYHA